MQLGLLGMLLGLPNGALTGGQGQGGGQGAIADMFAQLLGDQGQGQGQYTPQGGTLVADIAPGSLLAQEVGATGAGDIASLNDLLNQEISADDAQALLDQLAEFNGELTADADAAHQELQEQLKASLTEIKDGGESKKVGALLAGLSALQQAAQATTDRTGSAERLLAWMKGALAAKQKDAATQDAANEEDDDGTNMSLAQSLQASMFRDADSAAQAQKETAATRDYIEIVPLNVALEAAPAWIKKITDAPVTGSSADEIPGLELAANDDLPEVNLPNMAKPQGKDDKVTNLMDFRAMMENTVAQNSGEPDAAEVGISPLNAASGTHATQSADHRGAVTLQQPGTHANHAPVAEQVHVAVQRATKEGIDLLTISLEPADLGRVEVRMHKGADGQTQISFLVDKAETLDSLARDARGLERMLQDAGVKADAGSMQFNLRQQPSPDTQGDGNQNGRPNWDGEGDEPVGPQSAIPANQKYTLTLRDGVDIRA